jgi:UDP-N-acetylmuramate dehydrogenase
VSERSVREIVHSVGKRLQDLGFLGRLEYDFALAPLTSYKLGGPAGLYLEPENESDLDRIDEALREYPGCPLLAVGRGSNLVVSDTGFEGIVVRLGSGFRYVRFDGTRVIAGGILPLPFLAKACAERGLEGMEFAAGIPASVGGAVAMNAGGHGSEIAEVLESAVVHELGTGRSLVAASEMRLGYRSSAIGLHQLVVEARFCLRPGDPALSLARIAEIVRWRREHHPGGLPNAGSVFKNPDGDSAGRLIDAAGLKGLRSGGAEVSTKHANFIVTHPGAKAEDVVRLIYEVRSRVFRKFGVLLEPEVRLVGDFGELGRDLQSRDAASVRARKS